MTVGATYSSTPRKIEVRSHCPSAFIPKYGWCTFHTGGRKVVLKCHQYHALENGRLFQGVCWVVHVTKNWIYVSRFQKHLCSLLFLFPLIFDCTLNSSDSLCDLKTFIWPVLEWNVSPTMIVNIVTSLPCWDYYPIPSSLIICIFACDCIVAFLPSSILLFKVDVVCAQRSRWRKR